MSKTNKKSINYGFKLLAFLAFALILVPFNNAAAVTPTYVGGHYNADGSFTFGDFVWNNQNSNGTTNNTTFHVNSFSPSSFAMNAKSRTLTIIGNNFTPNSIVKINGSSRPTTFIDYSHLLVQLTPSDMNRTEGFYITVYDETTGKYSNATFFTVSNGAAYADTNTNGTNAGSNTNGNFNTFSGTTNGNNTGTGNGFNTFSGSTNGNNTNTDPSNTSGVNSNSTTTDTNSDINSSAYSNLASNAIFGSNSFLPSGLVQWVLLVIIILLIVIMARKIFGAEEEYHAAPMKHA